MDNFLRYFAQDFGRVFKALIDIFGAFFNFLNYLLNFPMRMEIIRAHEKDFSTLDWVLLLVANLVLLVLLVIAVILLVRLLRRIFRFRVSVKEYDEMARQVRNLQKDLIRANYEKDKLLSMRVAELGGSPEQAYKELMGEMKQENLPPELQVAEGDGVTGARNTFESPCVDPTESRFFRLTTVDNYYKTQYRPPEYISNITLEEFCVQFRNFSANTLRLYYDLDMIRYFIAALGTVQIVILQGISGTGKTSLPYAFGKFVKKDTSLVSVQPSWRERTELYGYYNEFTKKYSETDFLRAIYEANYYSDPHILILDEMNIARVEYYFAEMLSILEMPRVEERKVDIVSAMWDNDPCLIHDGMVQIPANVWFVGTINNDESTFAVADKVYDRAIPIDLDSRAEPFAGEPTEPIHISADLLHGLFREAKEQYVLSQELEEKLEVLNQYLIKNFRLAFGNRVIKQVRDFVSCFIACGGTEIQAVDFIVAKKVLRKFESLSLGFMKDDLSKFSAYLDRLFGKNAMKICKDYIELLRKNN